MLRKNLTDDFFDKQPERAFEADLREFVTPKIAFARPKTGEITPKGLCVNKSAFENEEALQTVWSDFERFGKKNALLGNGYGISLVKNAALEKEEFFLEVTAEYCTLTAGETEGVRRGMIRLQDLLLENGGNLKIGETHEKAVIKRRISRCFFSPTNRPPRNGAELQDDVDYYPDGYLNRLMHDGINGIWIYSSFDELLHSSYITEFGEGSERRIKKLNATIEKCARYGIEVFLFVLEPISLNNPTVEKRHPGLLHKYPQVHGNRYFDKITREEGVAFCTYSDFGKNYCIEAVEKLFTIAPKLGGLMSITQGERITSCSTVWENEEFEWKNVCPRCSKYSKAEVLVQKVDVLREGMRRVKPSAEFISWTYEHRNWKDAGIVEYVEKAPADVALMQNFEDNGRVEQLGKTRVAIDYWLSYTGPSHMFELTAETAKRCGKQTYAKMQVCCSHELASVPYIPVPGIIYDKLTRAKELGVTGIMESWYFGNYPCLMSKAAEILSFDKPFADKKEFLGYLAGLYFDGKSAEKVAQAWECFERAYTSYPVNVMFSYYGPLHDGIVWELALKPKNFAMSRSWLLLDRTDGDRLGECLFAGHTAEEADELLTEMDECWQKGCEILSETEAWQETPEHEQFSVAQAIGLLINSCRNIVRFYRLRNELGYGRGNARELLVNLREIVEREIENSSKMIPLCEADNRLGFHSEAEGYKFFPEKLRARIASLQKLLETEFTETEARLEQGVAPLAYYEGEEEGVKRCVASRTGLDSAEWETLSDGSSKFRVAVDGSRVQLELYGDGKKDFVICNEWELCFPSSAVIIKSDGRVVMHRDCITHQSLVDERTEAERQKWTVEDLSKGEETHLVVTLDKAEIGFVRLPYKCMIKTTDKGFWNKDPNPTYTLGKAVLSPGDFGWIV
ncbi:MAG: hypothetical protein IJZ32_01075 [Clostridia bacterium]|nr:hypothetical protein [Clostridia bacterium]